MKGRGHRCLLQRGRGRGRGSESGCFCLCFCFCFVFLEIRETTQSQIVNSNFTNHSSNAQNGS